MSFGSTGLKGHKNISIIDPVKKDIDEMKFFLCER